MQTNPNRDEMLQLVKDAVTGSEFSRATFAGATRGTACEWVRVVVRPVELRGERHVQFAYQSAKKVITKNFPPAEVDIPLDELLGHGFAGVHISLRNRRKSTSARAARAAFISAGTKWANRERPKSNRTTA